MPDPGPESDYTDIDDANLGQEGGIPSKIPTWTTIFPSWIGRPVGGRSPTYPHLAGSPLPTWTMQNTDMEVIFQFDIPTPAMQNTDMDVANFSATTDMDVAKYRHRRYFLSCNSFIINAQNLPKEKVNMLYQEKHHHGGVNFKPGFGSDDAFLFLRKGVLHG